MMIRKPTLVLDEERCKENIAFMVAKAHKASVDFRPHFKTHQSLEIGRWFKELGVNKITVSSLSMAEYFAKEWDDITVAFPLNPLELPTINSLASRINLNLLIESVDTLNLIKESLTAPVNLFIKINIGNDRTGLIHEDLQTISDLINSIEKDKYSRFKGFLGHAGQTYKCRSVEEITEVHHKAKGILTSLKERYIKEYPDLIISYGDTPSCSVCENFEGIDEIRPGNFVFYDLMQVQIRACTHEKIAVALACPVVAIHEERNEVVVYGGGIHLSKDSMTDQDGKNYGRLVNTSKGQWGGVIPDCHVKALSQEHGIITVSDTVLKGIKIGDLVYILPVHSCMTANLMKGYLTREGRRIEMFNP